MQYPHIQFYRGSLVRLASGKLKQVEDLSSDDFIESARLASGNSSSSSCSSSSFDFNVASSAGRRQRCEDSSASRCGSQQSGNSGGPRQPARAHQFHASSAAVDENNNSVFNSPEPNAATRSSFNESPLGETEMETERNCDRGLDEDEQQPHEGDEDEQDEDVELDVVNADDGPSVCQEVHMQLDSGPAAAAAAAAAEAADDDDDFYVDSSVVRDFLEVGPIIQQHQLQRRQLKLASASSGHLSQDCGSPTSSTGSLTTSLLQLGPQQRNRPGHANSNTAKEHHLSTGSLSLFNASSAMAHKSASSSSSSLAISPPIMTSAATVQQPETVLIKFFLEASRSVAFIEVPTEHPFFVFHRGWSSWNPQKTYDKFGLKCRKLKIGDTCISLIRKKRRPLEPPNSSEQRRQTQQQRQQQESDHCDVLFSSIKIHE